MHAGVHDRGDVGDDGVEVLTGERTLLLDVLVESEVRPAHEPPTVGHVDRTCA